MSNAHSAGGAHGIRSDSEKAVADLRDDLIDELKLISKYEAQLPVLAAAEFPGVSEVTHILGHIRDAHQRAAGDLMEFIKRLDAGHKREHSHDEKSERKEHAHHRGGDPIS